MPLILAVEPDRKQAARIAALGRGPLQAEFTVTESAEQALGVLATRVPDLVLTSQLLSPKDDAALTDRLRELDAAGIHVQTLVIPVLGSAKRRSTGATGLLNRLRQGRSSNAAPDGCDPAVFAAQIVEYLDRAAAERESRGEAFDAPLSFTPAERIDMPAHEPPVLHVAAPIVEDPILDDFVQAAAPAQAQESFADTVLMDDIDSVQPQAVAAAEDAAESPAAPWPAELAVTPELAVSEERVAEEAAGAPEAIELSEAVDALEAAIVLEAAPTPADDKWEWEDFDLDGPETEPALVLSSEMIDLDAFVQELEAADPRGQRPEAPPVSKRTTTPATELAAVEIAHEPVLEMKLPLDPPAAWGTSAWPRLEGLEAAVSPSAFMDHELENDAEIAEFVAALEAIDPARPAGTPPSPHSEERWIPPTLGPRYIWPRLDGAVIKVPALAASPADPGPTPNAPREPRAAQDEWGFFDPEQCGFSALLAKLVEITDQDDVKARSSQSRSQ